MDMEKAIQILKRCGAESYCSHYKRHYCCIGCGQREALDLAIEALGQKSYFHCPKCGTIVRDGRQYHDLVYRGEAETLWEKGMRSFDGLEKVMENRGDAESATTTDCINRKQAIEALTGWQTEPLDEDIVRTLEALPPVPQKQVTSKLNNPDDSLLKADSDECKEQKSKLDCISRQQAIEAVKTVFCEMTPFGKKNTLIDILDHLPPATLQNISKPNNIPPVTPTERTGEWIPVSERLPEWWETEDGYVDSKPVLVCYANADDFYHNMAVAEYVGRWEVMDDYAPLGDPIAWQPLPEPYKGGDSE